MSMTMEIHPNGGGAIQITVTLGVEEIRSFAAFDDNRLLLFPLLHLGKGCHRYCRSHTPSEGACLFAGHASCSAETVEGDAGKPSASAGAARIIRGALYFDNLGGSNYNEPILLKK